MRYTPAEKYEIIKLVEGSEIGAKKTLKELTVNRSTFYRWYERYQLRGYEGLSSRSHSNRHFWNMIPSWERERIVKIALGCPDKSPRELAWYITDNYGYYISESSVYRILKANNLITSPAFILVKASDKFKNPTKVPNELWQTDFTYFKIVHWGWRYLATVLDDYSRYIIAWRLCTTMDAPEVKAVLDEALFATGLDKVRVIPPKLLSDNGPCYVSEALKEYLTDEGIKHIRGRPYHPQTQGKIERYHRSMKNIVNLDKYYWPQELEDQIRLFVAHYNNYRYHESLENLTPADVYYGRAAEILEKRRQIKLKTLTERRKAYFDNLRKRNYIDVIKTVS